MEQYRRINTELIEQVQSQRQIIGEMKTAAIELKKQWMEEREMRLTDLKHQEIKVKSAVMKLIQTLDLDLDVNITSQVPQMSENRPSRLSTHQICSDFRRSSTLLQRRITLSPTKITRRVYSTTRKSPGNDLETMNGAAESIAKTPEPRRLVDLLGNTSPSELEEESPMPQPNIPGGLMCSIIEESESDENDTSSEAIALEETLEQLTLSESTESEKVKRQGHSKKGSVFPLHSVQLYSPAKSPRSSKNDSPYEIHSSSRVARRNYPSEKGALEDTSPLIQHLTNCGQYSLEVDNQEPIIHAVRTAPLMSSAVHLAVPCTSLHMDANNTNLTPRKSLVNFNKFNYNLRQPNNTSTPREGQKGATTTMDDVFQQSSSDFTTSGRPVRSCRPKSLKEASIKHKLRNENSVKL